MTTKRLSDLDDFEHLDEVEVSRMPLMEHLRELRYRIMVSGAALVLGMVAGMAFATDVFAFLTAPIRMLLDGGKPYPEADALYLWLTQPTRAVVPAAFYDHTISGSLSMNNSPLEGIQVWFNVALITGFSLASPIIAFQGWQFVAPGLYPTERRLVFPLTAASTFLFFVGMAFAYIVMLPIVLPFFLTVLEVESNISIDGYLRSTMKMLIAFGASFQLPIVVWFAAKLGLIDHKDMIKGFRYAVVVLFIIAAIVTPSPDILSQILVGVPMTLLYILSIAVAWMWTTKKRLPIEDS